MPRINYKQSAYVSATIALFLIVGNIYYFFIYRDVGLSYYFEKAFSPGKDAVLNTPDYLDMVEQYEYLNQSVNAAAIVFLGDSHTQRFKVEEYFQGYNTVNRGVHSDTTVSLLARLDRNVNNLKISKLFLLIGYNDLQYRTDEEVIENIKLILNRIKAEKIYLLSMLPVAARMKNINSRIVAINDDLSRQCVGTNADFVNLHKYFLNETGGLSEKYSLDGIHLNGSGYLLWKEVIEQKLR